MPHFPDIDDKDDVQHWWEVPAIAHFCHLFKDFLKMKPMEIEELEETLLLHGSSENDSHVAVLAKNLLKGITRNMSEENWQEKLAGIWERQQQGSKLSAPFTSLPLRQKVRVLYLLCHLRMDIFDANTMYKKLDMDSLRADCLGEDSSKHIYWYFFGLRLYKELKKDHLLPAWKKKQSKNGSKEEVGQSWSVVCRQLEDWHLLVERLKESRAKSDIALRMNIERSYLPLVTEVAHQRELDEKKKLQEMAPRRVSSRLEQKRITRRAQGDDSMEDQPEETVEERRKRVARERARRVEERLRAAERSANQLEEIPEEVGRPEFSMLSPQNETPTLPVLTTGLTAHPDTKKLIICLVRADPHQPITSLMNGGVRRLNGTTNLQDNSPAIYPNGFYRVRNDSPGPLEEESFPTTSEDEEMEVSPEEEGMEDPAL